MPQIYTDPTTKKQVYDQNGQKIDVSTGNPIVSDSISTADLAPVSSLQLPPTPQEPNYQSIIGAIPQIDLAAFQTTTPVNQTQNDLSKRILEITEKLGGRTTAQAKAEETVGVPKLKTQLTDITNQLQALQKEAAAIPIQIQEEATGRGITHAGAQPIEAGRLRQNAIKALGLSAIGQTLQGNLTLAQAQANRAVELEFQPEETKLEFLKVAYQMNKDILEREDKKRSQALQIQLAERERILNEQREDRKAVFDVIREAARSGADVSTLDRMSRSRTPEEALGMGGFALGEEVRNKIEQQKFDRQLQEVQLNLSYRKFEEDTRQFNLQYALTKQKEDHDMLQKLQKQNPAMVAEATSSVLQDKIDLIDNLLKSPGLAGSVGPYKFSRFTPFSIDKAARQEFSAGVTQLVNKETIDTLVNLKARGGTLGALSDQERLLLQSAATKIGSWEIKDDKGLGTGRYAISEEAFKKELNTIKNLALKAKARALGGGGFETGVVNESDELRKAGYSEEQIRLLLELR